MLLLCEQLCNLFCRVKTVSFPLKFSGRYFSQAGGKAYLPRVRGPNVYEDVPNDISKFLHFK